MNKRKVLFYLFAISVFAGFFGLVGTAGALDFEEISFGRAIIQYAVSITLLIAGAIGVNKFYIDEGSN